MPPPASGRTYAAERRVRLGDVTPKGRVRLDAVARYLQDVANDDATDAIPDDAMWWVVRSTTIAVERWPVFREHLALTTWGSGIGARWAERRTSIVGERGSRIEAASLWVHVHPDTGAPARLIDGFLDVYGEAAAGRKVHARLTHGDPPAGAVEHPWPVRAADLDLLGHMNNAVYWAMVEEHLPVHAPCTVTVEYRGGVDQGQVAVLLVDGDGLWVVAGETTAASARVLAT